MKVSIVQYPGSHGAKDAEAFLDRCFAKDIVETRLVWHLEESFEDTELVIVPGGTSFGDFLSPGRLAKASPISSTLKKYCSDGRPAVGLGNGFQILCEIGALPGVLLPNAVDEFISGQANVLTQKVDSPLLRGIAPDTVLQMPFACRAGRYFGDTRSIKEMEEEGQVALRYCDEDGDIDPKEYFNLNSNSIAAVLNSRKTTLGTMLHPEQIACSSQDSNYLVSIVNSLLN